MAANKNLRSNAGKEQQSRCQSGKPNIRTIKHYNIQTFEL
jgi:hypothetical protein